MGVGSARVTFGLGANEEGIIDVPPPPRFSIPEMEEPFEVRFMRLLRLGQRHFGIIHFDPLYYMNTHLFNSIPEYTNGELMEFEQKLNYCLSQYAPNFFIIARFGSAPNSIFYGIDSYDNVKSDGDDEGEKMER